MIYDYLLNRECVLYFSNVFYYYRYHMDPSGTFIKYEAKAIGSGSEGAQQALQDVYHKVRYTCKL